VWFAVFVREWGLVVFFFYFFDECLFLCTGDAWWVGPVSWTTSVVRKCSEKYEL